MKDNPSVAKNSTKKLSPDSSILIVLMGSLGDVVRGLYLAPHIKDTLPRSKIAWLIEPKWLELVKLHPMIDKVIIFDRPKGVPAVWGLYKVLAQEHFDITLDLQRHLKSGFFSFLSRAKRRIGFDRRNAKELNWLFNNEQIGHFSDDLSKLLHYLKFTEYLGLPHPTSLKSGFNSIDLSANIPKIIAEIDEPLFSVIMGSAWESKDWLFEGYSHLVQNIFSSGKGKVVLLGDRTKEPSAIRLSKPLGPSGPINLVGKTSLLELASVLKGSAVAVGPDSGPGHLAAAIGTPYVSIFGPTSPVRTAPYGCEHLVVYAGVDCAPCYRQQCPGLDKICMRKISVSAVEQKLSEALAMGHVR
jgi:ADP-heptose:LPS heptosyltransferase